MDAFFKRSEAFTRLESYAQVIVLYLALVELFSDSHNVNHWKKEINAFKGVLKRYDKAKSKAKHNFATEDISRALREIIEDNDDREYLIHDVLGVEKSLVIDYQQVDWKKIENSIEKFAKDVMEN